MPVLFQDPANARTWMIRVHTRVLGVHEFIIVWKDLHKHALSRRVDVSLAVCVCVAELQGPYAGSKCW